MNKNNIGSEIKRIRIDNNLTQKQLAEKYNVKASTISSWETGKSVPDNSIIEKICTDYNLKLETKDKLEEKNMRNKIYVISMLSLALIIACTLTIKQPNNIIDLSYKAIEGIQGCELYNTITKATYDKSVNILNLKDITFCKEEDNNTYDEITATLYEGEEIEISTYSYNEHGEISIAEFLKKTTFSLENYSSCEDSLFIKIIATNNDTIKIYTMPIMEIEECE